MNVIDRYSRLARIIAYCSFIIGTAIFIWYYYIGKDVLLVGYAYIIIAALFNLPVAAFLAGMMIKTPDRKAFDSLLLMLLNIPVMIFYVWFAFKLMDTARITFRNTTGYELTNLHLEGCEEISIGDMEPGETETVWVDIPHDCSVSLSYTSNGDTIHASVEGYLTTGFGGSRNYNIGGFNEPDEHVR